MHVCVPKCVFMHAPMCVHMCIDMCAPMCVHMRAHMHVHMHIYFRICKHTPVNFYVVHFYRQFPHTSPQMCRCHTSRRWCCTSVRYDCATSHSAFTCQLLTTSMPPPCTKPPNATSACRGPPRHTTPRPAPSVCACIRTRAHTRVRGHARGATLTCRPADP